MLGILGEGPDDKGHDFAGIGGVGGARRSSVEGGLDLDDFRDDVENNLVRLLFFFKGFEADELPSLVGNSSPDPPRPASILCSVPRSID